MCKTVITIVIPVSILTGIVITMVTMSDNENYLHQRNLLLTKEESSFFGGNITLTEQELKVDKILLRLKNEELEDGYKNSSKFLPLLHFFNAKEKIDQSRVFALIRKIPKGASLHTHLLAAVSADFIIKNITYRNNLYFGWWRDMFKLKFLTDPNQDQRCNWTSVEETRLKMTPPVFDKWLRKKLVLNVDNPRDYYTSAESVWKKFKMTFTAVYEMLSYREVFQDYIYQVLQELYEDNVMYTELKGTIMILYDDNTTYSKEQFFEIFQETVNRFKQDHSRFIGVRYIHSIYRGVDPEALQTGLEEIIQMKKLFPDFIAGFDFVGYEEEGKTLRDYYPQLIKAKNHLEFFFHAGETNWFGHTDVNLVDAILLKSLRIGHGFALTKHPEILKLGKKSNIPLEICPISNQVLMLNMDHRNHPAATLMALDYPVVICNDDPALWNATGLSYDWYIAFMAMTPRTSGLEVLKQFAVNSIKYSAMDQRGKNEAMAQWEQDWGDFLLTVINN